MCLGCLESSEKLKLELALLGCILLGIDPYKSFNSSCILDCLNMRGLGHTVSNDYHANILFCESMIIFCVEYIKSFIEDFSEFLLIRYHM